MTKSKTEKTAQHTPDLLEAAKAVSLEARKLEADSIALDALRAAIAAEEARRKAPPPAKDLRLRKHLADALLRWEGDPRQLFLDVENMENWACAHIRHMNDGRERGNNTRVVVELCRALKLLFKLDGWEVR